jgi:tetratricopeptide (TPR) repeat protein
LLKPSATNCKTLLDSLCDYCHEDIQDYALLFQIAENVVKVITNANADRHFDFICAIYPIMHKQMYGHGMKMIINSFDKDENCDYSTLYHFKAMYEESINNNPHNAFEFEKQAFEFCDNHSVFAFKINSNLGYYYHHFGNHELAEQHYRNAFSLCNRHIEYIEEFNDVILATRQYINLIIDSNRKTEALDMLEKWIEKIREQFGEMCSPYADMMFYKGLVHFKSDGSENTKSGWYCFQEAVRVYNAIYENNTDELREKIELIMTVIQSLNLSPPPDFAERINLPLLPH